MKLPERYYYRVESLNEINKNYTVENLIHYAATGRLEFCVKLNSTEFIEGYCLIMHEKTRLAWRGYKYSIIPNVEYRCIYGNIKCNIFNPIEDDAISDEQSAIEDICCLFSIDSEAIRKNELSLIKGDKINATWLNLPRDVRDDIYKRDFSPSSIKMKNDYLFDISDLFITKVELDKLNNGGEIIQSEKNENIFNIPPHPTAERHAINRELILNAALRLIEEQPNVFEQECRKPDGSINFSGFARELLNRSSFFPDNEIPIKTQDSIAGILSNAYKSPNQK
ncbi:hypothetical protein KDV38_09480 [Providencia rettgeri]